MGTHPSRQHVHLPAARREDAMKALVIDDSRVMRKIVGGILTGAGFDVVEAADGQEALDQMETHADITLCCIDWNMPVMSGFEFVIEVRKHAQWRDVTLM